MLWLPLCIILRRFVRIIRSPKIIRFGRLWIVGTEYQADGQVVRYADLVGVDADDETDGGPLLR